MLALHSISGWAGFIWLIGVIMLAGCSLGPLKVRETHYLAVSNGRNTNYYRLRVEGSTMLGVAGYRSGWYPARAVDRLFGEVVSDAGPAELQARIELETKIIEKVKETHEEWLKAASNPDANPARLKKLNEARRRVLAYPAFRAEPFLDTVEIEYNPTRDIVTFHSGDKLLFVLGSNPDDVIQAIASTVEDDKTVLSINRLASTITHLKVNEVAAQEAAQEVDTTNDARLRKIIKDTMAALSADPAPAKAVAAAHIDVLLNVLDVVNP
jgi:hypothetical protein